MNNDTSPLPLIPPSDIKHNILYKVVEVGLSHDDYMNGIFFLTGKDRIVWVNHQLGFGYDNRRALKDCGCLMVQLDPSVTVTLPNN